MPQMDNRTAAFITLGCRVNQYESDAIAETLREAGVCILHDPASADCVIVNTCTVTGESDRKSRQMIRRAAAAGAAVFVTGCFAQKDPAAAALPGVVYVGGNGNKSALAGAILDYLAGKAVSSSVPEVSGAGYDPLTLARPKRYRTFIKIEDGCENRCAYCIIPSVRGKVRSKAPGEVLREAAQIAACGSPEIILTGIETASYGLDLPCAGETRPRFGEPLAALLTALDCVPGVERIGLGSLEPTVMQPAFVETLASLSHILPHFHLSIQSGSDGVLRRMRRRYTAGMALEAMRRVRHAIPDVTFSADIITGFPGETDEEAAETAAFLAEADFLHLHLFPYSRRAGTEAASMEQQVPEALKRARLRSLEAEQNVRRLAMLQRYVQAHAKEPVHVLWEEWQDGIASGHSQHYVEIHAAAPVDPAGQCTPVLLTDTDGAVCCGRIL